MSSQDTTKPHDADTLRLFTELQSLLDDPSPATCSPTITSTWNRLRDSYHTNAEHLESRKRELGGSWDEDTKPNRADRCQAKYVKCVNSLTAATRDHSTHSLHTLSLGRQILTLSSPHQEWDRTFLSYQFSLSLSDLNKLNQKCENLKLKVQKWAKRSRHEDRKAEEYYTVLESEIKGFAELYRKMEEAEEKVKEVWARERVCEAERGGLRMEVCAEEVRELEAWRCWDEGRMCGGVSVWNCVMDHEHN